MVQKHVRKRNYFMSTSCFVKTSNNFMTIYIFFYIFSFCFCLMALVKLMVHASERDPCLKNSLFMKEIVVMRVFIINFVLQQCKQVTSILNP